MSQALYLREFLETFHDEVIISKVTFVPIFYYLLTQPFETKETTIFSLLHTTPIPFLLLKGVDHKEYYLHDFRNNPIRFTQAEKK